MKTIIQNYDRPIYVDVSSLSEYRVTNEESKRIKETMAITNLAVKMNINLSEFIKRESPDFEVKMDGKRIGIEIVEILPVGKHELERAVEKIVRKCLKDKKIGNVYVNIVLSDTFYSTKPKLKKNKRFEVAVLNALNGEVNEDYFLKFEIEPLWFKLIPEDKMWLYMPVCVGHRGGHTIPIDDSCVEKAIEKKENEFSNYIRLNINNPFDEYWLCVNLPYTESLYTIKGYHLPKAHKSNYSRIYIAQDIPFWCHQIYPPLDLSNEEVYCINCPAPPILSTR